MILSRGGAPEIAKVPYPIIRVKGGQRLRFTVLTQTWVDVRTHYNGRGTNICPGTPECTGCRTGMKTNWNAYVIGRGADTNTIGVVSLTPLSCFNLTAIEWRNGSLRGAKVALHRLGENDNSPLEGGIYGWSSDPEELSMDELEHVVRTIYKLHGKAHKFVRDGETGTPSILNP